MDSIREKIGYLKGIVQGMDVEQRSPEAKLLTAIVDVLDDMSRQLEDVVLVQEQFADEMESIDEDLAEIEKIVFEEEAYESDEDDMNLFFIEIECPHCGEKISITRNMIDEEEDVVKCPVCGKNIDIEWTIDSDDEENH